jgi:hypothetical protein
MEPDVRIGLVGLLKVQSPLGTSGSIMQQFRFNGAGVPETKKPGAWPG